MLSVDTLAASHLIAATDSATAQKGRMYYYAARCRIEFVSDREARLWVRGSRPQPYKIEVRLDGGRAVLTCDCPMADGDPGTLCKHKVAAALALQQHLQLHPPVTWETVLSQAIQGAPRRAAPASQSVLFFSLQQRTQAWAVYPYSLPANLFAEIAVDDPEAVADVVRAGKLSRQVKKLRSRVDPRRFVNATDDSRLAAQLCSLGQQYSSYYYYTERWSTCDTLLPLLATSLVYTGAEDNPLKQSVRITLEKVRPEIQVTSVSEGLSLGVTIALNGQDIPLDPRKCEVFCEDPFWVLANGTLVQIEDVGGSFKMFLEHPGLVVPKEDEGEFLDRYLLPLAERIPVRGDAVQWEEMESEPAPRLYLSEVEGSLRAHLRFGYGDYELPYDRSLPEAGVQRKPDSLMLVRVQRRQEAEQQAWQALSGFGLKRGTGPDEFLLRANTQPADFLLHQVPRLAEAGYTVFGEQALTTARVNRNRPTFSLNVSSGIDWFDVEAVVNFGDIEVALKEIRRAIRKRERYIKLADGSIGELPAEWFEKYRHLFALAEETDEGLRLGQHHLTLLDQLLSEADRSRTDPEFERRRQRLRDFTRITPQPLPQGFVGELRPYQKAGYDWLHFLHEYGFGGCLADDMGIGKTVQALAFLLSLRENGHAQHADLVVVPRSLLFNWEREAARFTPGLRIRIHADQSRPRDVAEFDGCDLLLTTYGIMLRDIELFRNYEFHYALLDESQAIKNPLSQTGKAARLLRTEHRLVLTGTPVENSTTELWSQFAFLNPGLLGNLEYFREEFGAAIERRGDEGAAQFLRKMVYPFILRRTKDQVAPELPPRTERLLYTEMEAAQRKLYNHWRDYYRALLLGMIEEEGGVNNARMKILEGLLRLRQICNHPRLVDAKFKGVASKFELLLETLETLRSEGHKALIFSQFVQMLSLVREALDERGIPYSYLDGSTKDRQARVDTFQLDASIPFFLISLKAGGVGLNLTAADYVIHIDPWWNPAVEMQASDRTHRIGQDKPVFVYKLIMRDSVEEKILQLQDRKRALVQQLIATEGSFFKSLTRQDVEVLFA